MEHECTDLVREHGRVVGVVAKHGETTTEIGADLVIGTDGRHSTVRMRAELPHRELGAPIDVLWMRVSRRPSDGDQLLGTISANKFLVMLNRGDYWQCAYLIEKGSLEVMKRRGLPALHADLRMLAPWLGDRVMELASWDDLKLLTVTVDRLTRWSAPGVLCIGDAAHAMSPVGGVGINLAIQDAVAAANQLWRPLRDRTVTQVDLAAIQARRERPTRQTQALQMRIHRHMLMPVLEGHAERRLLMLRWALQRFAGIGRFVAKAIGVGYLPEHVLSPLQRASI
jgi:2-polyprenyl-6-methoxyphenol hydroxylase-like FAD-dependent oxidoreductase